LATVEISRIQLWQWLYHGMISPNQYRTAIYDVCKENMIPVESPVVGYMEKLLDLGQFHDFTSTMILLSKL
jgi:malate synthase